MKKSSTRQGLLIGLLILTLGLVQCSTGGSTAKRTRSSKDLYGDSAAAAVWRPTLQNDIPVAMNPNVQKWVDLFQGRFKENFDRWFKRLGHYGPTIESILVKEGAPKDLIYLAMIESGFNLKARSHASAVGPWQFISSTGRMYGLNNDYFMDDRSDLITATRAAARHLKDLYKTYGDWNLAMAAYNAGPGTVNRAIRGTRSNDYWTHSKSRFYRQETKDYVPKVLAALHIVKNYSKYGYSTRDFGAPLMVDRVQVPDATDVATIAKSAGTNVEIIQELNPHLVNGITRPGQQAGIFIPKGTKDLFQRRYASIPEDERVSSLYHKVAYRENLASISRRYGINKNRLAKLNNLAPNQPVSPGQVLRVPANHKLLASLATNSFSTPGSSGSWQTYTVRRGDTLGRIAGRFRTSSQKISSWNKLRARSHLRVGQRLKIFKNGGGNSGPAGLFYAAKPGFAPAAGRMSGVAHIIAKDQQEPADLSMTRKEAADILPKMQALTTELASLDRNEDQPSVVKMFDEPEEETVEQNQAAQTPRPTQVASKQALPVTYHVVRSGDTLSQIASRYRISVNALKQWNGLRSDTLRPNQRLAVQKGGRVAASPQQLRSANNRMIVHQTRSGDTLWKISKRYGVKVTDIKKWNGLRGDSLKPNQKIKILASAGRPAGRNVALVKS